MTTETPINISLTHTSKNENNYNEFKEYIIINNLDLQKQVLLLIYFALTDDLSLYKCLPHNHLFYKREQ